MKKLKLEKKTIADLTKGEMNEIKGGVNSPCWENLWTIYECDVLWTRIEP